MIRWSLVLTWLKPATPFCPFLFCLERGACLSVAVPVFPFFDTLVSYIYSRPAHTSSSDCPLQSYQALPCPSNCSLPIFQTRWFNENCLMLVIILCLYQIILPGLWQSCVCPCSGWNKLSVNFSCSGTVGHSECHDHSIKQPECSSVFLGILLLCRNESAFMRTGQMWKTFWCAFL